MQKKFKGNEASLQVFLHPDIQWQFKLACIKNKKTMREEIIKFVMEYISKNK